MSPSALNIAFFSAGTSNAYLQAGIASAKATAAKVGAHIDIFDGKFDAQTQFNQIQSAITSGKYNAFAVEAVDGAQVCNILTQTAAAQKILVSVLNAPLCGRGLNVGDAQWQPGTVSFIGGQSLSVYKEWIQKVIADNPGGGEVAIVNGPALQTNALALNEAAKAIQADKAFNLVANQNTDYTTPVAYTTTQTILQAHPNLKIILSPYSGITQGVVQAVDQAGKAGQVRVYDIGGNAWAFSQIKTGGIRQTVMLLPATEAADAVQALIDYVSGKSVPQFIDLTKSPSLPGTPFVTRQTVGKFTPEY